MSRSIALAFSWRGLSRDQQDTLLLLAVIALIVVPHFAHLPWWAVGFSIMVLLWRGWIAWRLNPLPSRWILLLLLVACIAGVLFSFRTIAGRDAGVTLTLMLLALKTLELRARRDAMVIFFLGFFAVLTHFLFSQSLLTAALMILAVLGLLSALIGAHMPIGKVSIGLRVKLALKMLLLGTPLAAALFIFFPRLSAPLWGMPEQERGRTGLSDTMSVGNVADLALDDSIAFRVEFAQGKAPAADQLYFRGPVLASFNGRQWTTLVSRYAPSVQLPLEIRPQGDALMQIITLEPQRKPWLFALDFPSSTPVLYGVQNTPVRLTPSLQLVTDKLMIERVRYEAVSVLKAEHGPLSAQQALRDYIALPPNSNPQSRAFAEALRREPRYAKADASALATLLLNTIREEKFSYTLSPGEYGVNSVDEFWFGRREGFCEHFAQAFVVMMRNLGVPARIVTGYQGAELNPFDGSYIVRQSHAHAWAEYWQEGKGWLRADPTAAVAPERVSLMNRTLAGQRGLFGVQAFTGLNTTLLQQLRAGWDALNNAWNQRVLAYNAQQQLDMLKSLGLKDPDYAQLAVAAIAAALLGGLAIAAWFGWEALKSSERWRKRRDPWARLWHRARKQLATQGVEVMAHEAPRSVMPRTAPLAAAARWEQWLTAMEQWRYASQAMPDNQRYTRLRRDLDTLKST